jgi:hypothetical protein
MKFTLQKDNNLKDEKIKTTYEKQLQAQNKVIESQAQQLKKDEKLIEELNQELQIREN